MSKLLQEVTRIVAGALVLSALALGGVALAATAPSGPSGSSGTSGPSGVSGSTGASGATTASNLLTPPGKGVFTGLTGIDAGTFQSETGKHPAVFGAFIDWGGGFHWAFNDAVAEHARLMLHLEAAPGQTPEDIADGHSDEFLLTLAQAIALHGAPVYIRLLPEMNNANNAYSADNMDGSSRGPAYSQSEFKQAWRRTVTILRGGLVSTIDAKLAALGMGPVTGEAPTDTIPTSPVAFIWCPETAGTPNVPSESAASYWPGSAYVDWVGTDFYSQFPNFAGLQTFYKDYPHKPFVFGEWAMWNTDSAAFVQQFFSFIKAHKRVKMIMYNEGYTAASPLLLSKYPAAAAAIRQQVSSPHYLGYAPEWQAAPSRAH